MDLDAARKALKQYFGYDQFRPMQEDIITSVLAGRDTIVLMPTGGGKSICFQIPALVMDGLTLVISPLIALMKDQVEGLRANGVRAAALNSTGSSEENRQVENLALAGELDLLYVSPEKMLSPDFFQMLPHFKLALVAIDEAHCISQWGHDFRPEYTQLHVIKQRFPELPVIALTATADKLTRKDIRTNIGLKDPNMFVSSFDRPNLSLRVVPGRDRFAAIDAWLRDRKDQSGIIYCLSRKSTETIAAKLQQRGHNARFYHAGMGPSQRSKVQEDFIRDDVSIICATIAFGMGIDKSNVRWVIHYNLPKNIEGYYQEIGRAGRDGLPSDTLLFYSYADVTQLQRIIAESGQPEVGATKLDRMQGYANARICRRKVLLSYFGEHLEENCGNCDICLNPPATIDGTIMAQKALSALMRADEQVASGLLIDILRGSARREILENGYDKLKTYGAGVNVPKNDWQEYLIQMIGLGLMEVAYDEGNALKVTEAGRAVLFEGRPVELVKPQKMERKSMKKGKEAVAAPIGDTEKLFQRLRKLRKQLADEQGVPPYIVFNDATLREMAERQPTTSFRMRQVSGVGDRKLRLYGDLFIHEVLQFLQE